jgi:heme/copper-type cytochrome/quinol oxidase subunit 3
MIETFYPKNPHKTHPQGPPPIILPPPDGPGDDGPYGDEGEEPGRFSLKNAHLVMLIVMGVETMFFAALFSACLVFRQASPVWPPSAFAQHPTKLASFSTLFLLSSALTMWCAQQARRRWEFTQSAHLLLSTALLGIIFLVCQGYEWVQLSHLGLTLASGIYSSIFYMLIGCHGLHASVGVIWLAVVTWRAYQEDTDLTRSIGLSLCSMYWYYLVVLWPVLYALLYFS